MINKILAMVFVLTVSVNSHASSLITGTTIASGAYVAGKAIDSYQDSNEINEQIQYDLKTTICNAQLIEQKRIDCLTNYDNSIVWQKNVGQAEFKKSQMQCDRIMNIFLIITCGIFFITILSLTIEYILYRFRRKNII